MSECSWGKSDIARRPKFKSRFWAVATLAAYKFAGFQARSLLAEGPFQGNSKAEEFPM